MDFSGLTLNVPITSVFNGEGDYAGLVAIVEFKSAGQGWGLKGVIIDGGLPPEPEPAPFELDARVAMLARPDRGSVPTTPS